MSAWYISEDILSRKMRILLAESTQEDGIFFVCQILICKAASRYIVTRFQDIDLATSSHCYAISLSSFWFSGANKLQTWLLKTGVTNSAEVWSLSAWPDLVVFRFWNLVTNSLSAKLVAPCFIDGRPWHPHLKSDQILWPVSCEIRSLFD